MRDLILVGITALVSASGGAFLAMSLADDTPPTAGDFESAIDVAEVEERLALLEQKMATDERVRQSVRSGDAPTAISRTNARPIATPPALADRRDRYEDIRSQRQRQTETRLHDAGWSEQEISALNDIRVKASLDFEQRQYEQMLQRLERNPDMFDQWPDRSRALRAELGDDRYAQFLEAEGRPTTVTLNNVLAGSAGAAAGLQPGDQIRRYGSERVFSRQDLTFAIFSGQTGEAVTVEFERNGSVFHVSVPRGPLGISDPMHR